MSFLSICLVVLVFLLRDWLVLVIYFLGLLVLNVPRGGGCLFCLFVLLVSLLIWVLLGWITYFVLAFDGWLFGDYLCL